MEFSVYSGVVFRAVEAQHAISTHKLVDSFEKQHRLERLIDQSKPSVVGGQRNLHYLRKFASNIGELAVKLGTSKNEAGLSAW